VRGLPRSADLIAAVRAYLLVLADREAIAWVLREQRMAFPSTPRAEVRSLAAGDRLYLYATRGAWRNPTRDRGRIIGVAEVLDAVRAFDEPIEIAGRPFLSGCGLAIGGVIPYPGGVELQPLVSRLSAFPHPHAWSVYLRRPLVALPDADVAVLDSQVGPLLKTLTDALPTYVEAARSRVSRTSPPD
jgi:hypothetical protein